MHWYFFILNKVIYGMLHSLGSIHINNKVYVGIDVKLKKKMRKGMHMPQTSVL